MNFLFNSGIKNILSKTKGLMLLFWSALIVDGRMAGDNIEKNMSASVFCKIKNTKDMQNGSWVSGGTL